ncbi:MAG TPA: hypothetical protein VJ046_01300 [Candidatus Paceibacterota bacterium]|nr:hypothetical protein [Candidatus Paceibacterota bacterium]
MKLVGSFQALFIFCFLSFYTDNAYAQQPENLPSGLSSEIADFVVQWGNSDGFNSRLPDEGLMYELKFFLGSEFYQVTVYQYNSGIRHLTLNYYLTNQIFDGRSSPAEFVARELMYGVPKIHLELHITDKNIDGTADVYQEFTKRIGPVYEGFTREERDRGKKAGVGEYLLLEGKVYRERRFRRDRWTTASEQERTEVRVSYEELLSKLAFHWRLIQYHQ